MQWVNPGYEFDGIYSQTVTRYEGKSVVIYGAGMMGGRIYEAISRISDLTVVAFLTEIRQSQSIRVFRSTMNMSTGNILKRKKISFLS